MSGRPIRVLMVTPYLPHPAHSGGRTRTRELLRAGRGLFETTLACLARPEERAADLAPLRELCELHVVERPPSPGLRELAWRGLSSPRPVTEQIYRVPALGAKLDALLRERRHDVIHVESFYLMSNLPPAPALPVLLAEPALEYQVWARHAWRARSVLQRPGIALEAWKMRRAEPRAWRRAQALAAVSQRDAESMRRHARDRPCFVVPNAVEAEHFRPGPGPRDGRTLLFLADYKYFPNVDAAHLLAREILPRVRRRWPQVRLLLLGKDPPASVRGLARDPAVTVPGAVADARPALQTCAVFVCPLRSGGGTRIKILEAMACGAPVVSTPVGCEGLDVPAPQTIRTGEGAAALADRVAELLDDPGAAEELGRAARAWVASRFGWNESAKALARAYETLSGARSSDA